MTTGEMAEKSLAPLKGPKPPQLPSPLDTTTEEVRFAVVMYGGISLAIYMNGIAQELLHLVRSTSPDPREHTKARIDLTPTEFEKWQKFYADYFRPQFSAGREKKNHKEEKKTHDDLVKNFLKRNFNDGGVLDNQPFGPTLETLPLHSADVPVTRKLVYIEPVPEHPELRPENDGPPDFVENAWLSLSTLPRYEPIRQHLQKVLERNRLVERIQHITEGIEQDVQLRYKGQERTHPLTAEEFAKLDIVDMIERNGVGWGDCQRLRVAEVTDDLTLLITRLAGFDERSDEFQAIRYIVRYWRMRHYSPYKPDRHISDESGVSSLKSSTLSPKLTENKFLIQFDLLWRLRRLRFVLNKIDDLACFDARGAEVMKGAEVKEAVQYPRFDSESSVDSKNVGKDEKDKQAEKAKKDEIISQAQRDFREALSKVKRDLSDVYRRLRAQRQQIWSVHPNRPAPGSEKLDISGLEAALADKPMLAERKKWLKKNFPKRKQRDRALLLLIRKKIADLKIPGDELLSLLENFPSEEKRDEKIKTIVHNIGDEKFQAFVDALDLALDDLMAAASICCNRILYIHSQTGLPREEERSDETPVERTVRRAASHYYRYFDNYDVIAHPILYATEVGDEIDFIEVFRISPEDAPSIIEETETDMREQNIRKLAGTKLSNFGGFFKEEFRHNDILWGRLDGAERIIAALLPGSDENLAKKRTALIKEVHQAIIKEVLGVEDESELLDIIKQMTPDQQESLKERLKDERVQFALGTYLSGQNAVDYFKEQFLLNYEETFQFNNQDILVDAARGSKVFGKMLEGYADKHQVKDKRVAWVTRLTQVFYGLVQVAIPDSIPNLVFHYWLQLLYLFEFLTILLGTLFVNPNMQRFGFLAFGLTVVLNGAELLIQDLMKGRRRWLNFVIAAFIAIALALTIIGLAFVIGLNSEVVWNWLAKLKGWYSSMTPGL
jgi:patatin-related protein